MRDAARKDVNHAEIIAALRAIGVRVYVLNQAGLPDILTYWRERWLPIELKVKTGLLTPAQQAVYLQAPFPIVRSVAEALALFHEP